LLALRAQPNDWHAQLSGAAKSSAQASGKGQLYRAFWTKLLDRVHAERPSWTRAKVAPPDSWFSMPSAVKGATVGVNFTVKKEIRTEISRNVVATHTIVAASVPAA
jgi:hypothetical protein